jgi:hypothetical protein
MKQIRIIGLALVVVFAVSAVAGASASAAPVWKLSGAEITKATTVLSESITEGKPAEKGSLKLADKKAGTEIECEGTDEGTVGPGNKDEVTKVEATKCKFIKSGSCEASKAVTAKAVELPWITELYEPEAGKIRDHVKAHAGGGAPGWKVECTVGGIFKVQDTCTNESNTAMNNVAGGVEAVFDAKTPKAKCSLGGEEGEVKGADLNKNPSTGTLTVG